MSLDIDPIQTLAAAILVLFLGTFVIERSRILRENDLPVPVVGGILFAAVTSLLYAQADVQLPGQDEPVQTLGLTATPITNAGAADSPVERLLDQVFASVAAVEDEAYRVGFIRRQTARVLGSVSQ